MKKPKTLSRLTRKIKKRRGKEWYKAQGCHLNSDGGISYGSYDSY